MEIRLYKKGDIEQIALLLGDSVSILDAKKYSETEIHSVAPNNVHFKDWEETCLTKFTVVAEINTQITGIGQIDKKGHISCFYCHPDYRGRGLGKQLYSALEQYAIANNITTIHTETSSEDRPFYLKIGFTTVQKQQVLIGGKVQTNFVIEKELQS